MRIIFYFIFIFCVSFELLRPAYSWSRTKSFYEITGDTESTAHKTKGFYFYQDADPEEEDKEVEPTKKKNLYDPPDIPWANLMSIPPAEFRKLLDEQLDYALINPQNKKAVKDYMIIQAEAVRRAQAFQRTWAKVLIETPGLDPTALHPTNRLAQIADINQRSTDREQILGELRENMAILFFSRAGCPYCEQQRKILENFVKTWKWENLKEIDILEFPQVAQDYQVEIVPDLYVVGNVHGDIRRQRLHAGLTTGDQILKSLMDAYSNWFKGTNYQLPQETQSDQMLFKSIQTRMDEGQTETASKNPGTP